MVAAEVEEQILVAQDRETEARLSELSRKFQEELRRLVAKGDQTGVELAEKLFRTDTAQVRLDAIEKKVAQTMERLRQAEQGIANRVTGGDLSAAGGKRETEAVRTRAADELRAAREEMQGISRDDLPQLEQHVDALNTQIDELATQSAVGLKRAFQELADQLQQINDSFATDVFVSLRDGLGQLFTDLATGSKGAKEAFEDFARSFAENLAAMAAQALATQLIVAVLDKIGLAKPGGPDPAKAGAAGAAFATPVLGASVALGVAGGVVTTGADALLASAHALASAAALLLVANTTSAGIAHTGGVVGKTSLPSRQVSGSLFAGAPRMHTGGLVRAIQGSHLAQAHRDVPARAFAGAPRMHGGGMPGLRPGEVPIIAQTGEEVLSRRDPRNVLNGGKGRGQGVDAGAGAGRPMEIRNILLFDPKKIPNYLRTPEGVAFVLDVLEENSLGAKQRLGIP